MRKNSGVHFIHPRPPNTRLCTQPRPPIPKFRESSKAQPAKDFKRINIKRVASTAKSYGNPKFTDTRFGDFQDLEKSGMLPVYIHNPKYGNVPEYLKKMKNPKTVKKDNWEILRTKLKEHELIDSIDNKLRALSMNEKTDLLKGLQHNWNLLQKEYQRLPLLTDTVPKMHRKTTLETNLKQLERDIVLLNSNQSCIYIQK